MGDKGPKAVAKKQQQGKTDKGKKPEKGKKK